MALRRRDNGRGVILDLDTSVVPAAREMQVLFPKAVAEQANADEMARFAALWQARVEQMLTRHADDPALVHMTNWLT
jgi:formylmethanofuran dehydrogenase subunit E